MIDELPKISVSIVFAGQAINPWLVFCFCCHDPVYAFRSSERKFISQLRLAGWKKEGESWYCPKCVVERGL